MENQISVFELLGMDETPEIPFEEQKEGVKGWVIETAGLYLVKNGFKEDMIGVTVRHVQLRADSWTDRENYKWQNAVTIDHCKGDGWIGGPKKLYARKPTWAECEKYVREHYKGEPFKYRIICVRKDGNACHRSCDYEDL